MLIRFLMLTVVWMYQVAAMQLAELGSLSSRGLMRRMTTASLPAVHIADGMRWNSTSIGTHKQVYTIPTYDAAFKWILSDNDIRPSFFHAFIPGIKIKSSERLDEHMNPVEKLNTLREFLHKEKTCNTVRSLSGSGAYVINPSCPGKQNDRDDAATAFLTEMVGRFDEIKVSFPRPRYDGTMDFVCKLDNNDYALVEMQVVPQDYWDRRALAYAAAFYGNQLSKGQAWKHIRKVISVNILGGGKDDKMHWVDTPDHFVRDYKFEEQLNGKGRFIDGIELIQYSIMQKPTITDRETEDWVTFFKDARYMNEKDVEDKIQTQTVKQAFERAKLSKLPADVQKAYEAEDKEYDRYSQHTDEQVVKGKLQAKQDVAISLIAKKMNDKFITETTGLTLEQVQALRNSGA